MNRDSCNAWPDIQLQKFNILISRPVTLLTVNQNIAAYCLMDTYLDAHKQPVQSENDKVAVRDAAPRRPS